MKNVTISLDARTLAWARREAAQRGMSVSRFIGTTLEERMTESRRYARAMQTFLSQAPCRFENTANGYPPRDELYARDRLR